MGRFNFKFGRRAEARAENSPQPEINQWEQMANEVNAEREEAERQQASTERQQRKIMAHFLTGDNQYIVARDVSLTPADESEFSRRLNSGEITKQDEENFLLKISGPIHRESGPQNILNKIEQDEWQKQLFGWTTGRNVSIDGVESIFEELRGADLRTPVGFEQRRNDIMNWLKPQVDERQYNHYEKSMDDLEKTLYGKRFEYYQAFEKLRNNARGGANLSGIERLSSRKQEVSRNSSERQESLLRHARIDGDPWRQDGREYVLTPDILRNCDLGPKYKAQIENQEINLSDIYELGGGRVAAMAYVPTDEGVKVRSYYRSNSQGVWRYLPDYARQERTGEGLSWYGKSHAEEATTLPYALQESLAAIMDSQGVRTMENVNPKFIFTGTAQAYDSKEDYRRALESGRMRGDFYQEVSATSATQEFGHLSYNKQRPEDINMKFGREPNFGNAVAEYDSESSLVGAMHTEVFRSYDNHFSWLMCTDSQERSWVGGIETSSPVTSTGCRREWVSAGDVATPLYEYRQMSDGYGDASDARSSHYVGMWNNYLSKIPLIRKYREYKDKQSH